MSTHAVGEHKKARFTGVAVPHAVFIHGPAANTAELKNRKLHLNRVPIALALRAVFLVSDTTLSNCSRTRSPTVSLV